MKEARDEIEDWKSTSEADKAELKSAQKEIERNMEALRDAHAISKGLEKEKIELMKRNDQIICGTKPHQADMEKLKAELELDKSKLSNGMLLEEACRLHLDFDDFAKDFSDAGFKFLRREIKETAPEFAPEPIKRWYAAKLATRPNRTPSP